MPKKSIARKPRSTTASQRDLGTLLFEKGARDDSAELVYLDVAKIDEDPNNARRTYDKAGLEALAESIRSNGLLEPVIVRAHPDDKGRYMLTAGSRRLRAHKLLGRKEIKAIVETGRSAAGVRSASAVENLQREQLHPHEEARAFQGMLDQGMTQEQVAAAAGVGLSTVKRRLRLLQLPDPIVRRIGQHGFSQEHAEVLLPLAAQPKMLEVAVQTIGEESKYGDGFPDVQEFAWSVASRIQEKKLATRLDINGLWQLTDADHGLKARLAKVPTLKVGGMELVTDTKALNEALRPAREKLAAKQKKERAAGGNGAAAHRVDYELQRQNRDALAQVRFETIVKATKGIVDLGPRELRAVLYGVINDGYATDRLAAVVSAAAEIPEKDAKALLAPGSKEHAKVVERLVDAPDRLALCKILVAVSLLRAAGEDYGVAAGFWKHLVVDVLKTDDATLSKEARARVQKARKEAATAARATGANVKKATAAVKMDATAAGVDEDVVEGEDVEEEVEAA